MVFEYYWEAGVIVTDGAPVAGTRFHVPMVSEMLREVSTYRGCVGALRTTKHYVACFLTPVGCTQMYIEVIDTLVLLATLVTGDLGCGSVGCQVAGEVGLAQRPVVTLVAVLGNLL